MADVTILEVLEEVRALRDEVRKALHELHEFREDQRTYGHYYVVRDGKRVIIDPSADADTVWIKPEER